MSEASAGQSELTARLLELGEQIVALAQIAANESGAGMYDLDKRGLVSAFSFDSTSEVPPNERNDPSSIHLRTAKSPLPDSRLVRKIIRQRQRRAEIFRGDLFADPAWDMLLDLTAARVEHKRVSVTSLCIASGVPATTALRWIALLVESGLVQRTEDDRDRRRAFISLSDLGADLMAKYFEKAGPAQIF